VLAFATRLFSSLLSSMTLRSSPLSSLAVATAALAVATAALTVVTIATLSAAADGRASGRVRRCLRPSVGRQPTQDLANILVWVHLNASPTSFFNDCSRLSSLTSLGVSRRASIRATWRLLCVDSFRTSYANVDPSMTASISCRQTRIRYLVSNKAPVRRVCRMPHSIVICNTD
jgi:hypothetical protein